MTAILYIMLIVAVFGGAVWKLYLKENTAKIKTTEKNAIPIIAVMVLGLAVHCVAALCYYGHETDMACFNGWSDSIFKNGLRAFYASDGFHDYPPGYVYIMYILGAVKNGMNLSGGPLQLWLKLPAIIADMVTAYIVYRFASRKFSDYVSATFAALIAFNPAAVVDSAVWGQIDSILALFCLLSVHWASEKKPLPAFLAFAAGVLIKPQALFFTPVLIYAVIDEVFLVNGFDGEKLKRYFLSALAAVAAMLVLFIPFGIQTIIKQYTETLGEYQYMTVNAFNIYAAVGKNWEGLGTVSAVFGYAMIAIVVAYSAYVFFKSKSPARYYIAAFILAFGTYMLSIKMHERYAFPALFMLIFALVALPTTKNFIMFGLFSLSQYFNMTWILFIYNQDINKYFRDPVVSVASWINVIFMAFCVYVIQKEYVAQKEDVCHVVEASSAGRQKVRAATTGASRTKSVKKQPVKQTFNFRVSEPKMKLTKTDIIAMAAIIAIYSVIAITNLGNKYAPQSGVDLTEGAVTIDLGEEKEIGETSFFLGARELNDGRNIDFKYMDSSKNVVMDDDVTSGAVFYWTDREIGKKARYIEISTTADDGEPVQLNEVCFLDNDGEMIEPVQGDDALFDEQEMFTPEKSYMAETYFDEIYHARTAYEFIHHMSVYEWTHPPLGKVLIGIGIRIFGMTPFGWRIVGTIFGIFMIPVIYLFAKRMLKRSWLAIVTCLIFTFDFMHFAQTRIATIDTYVTFFIMLMYYYMYKYYKMSFNDTPLKKTLVPLGLSGIFFGFAVASKWTGLYAGAGLAAIFFYTLYLRYNEYRYARAHRKGVTNGISHEKVEDSFDHNLIVTLVFCVVMFIIVPALIYTCSYIPYFNTPSGHGLKTIVENADSMFTYHSKTVVSSTHPYSSHWYEWPIMYRPIWYFSNTLENGLKQGISSFGNPAVWWLGIGAVAYMVALAIVTPLKKLKTYETSKHAYIGVYALIFVLFCAIAYGAGRNNENLERLFPCSVLYSCVFVGIFALVVLYSDHIKVESNRIALFLAIGYFAELLPWVAVVRTTYIYHYFPCVPFTVLMIGYAIKTFFDSVKGKTAVIVCACAYAGLTIVLFAMFYPVLSGQPCNPQYADDWLKWFSSWVLL